MESVFNAMRLVTWCSARSPSESDSILYRYSDMRTPMPVLKDRTGVDYLSTVYRKDLTETDLIRAKNTTGG